MSRLDDNEYGYKMQVARLSANMGLRTAAKELGVSEQKLSDWEKNERLDEMPPTFAIKMAKLYKKTNLAAEYCTVCSVIRYMRENVSPELSETDDGKLIAQFHGVCANNMQEIDLLALDRPDPKADNYREWVENVQVVASRIETLAQSLKALIGNPQC